MGVVVENNNSRALPKFGGEMSSGFCEEVLFGLVYQD